MSLHKTKRVPNVLTFRPEILLTSLFCYGFAVCDYIDMSGKNNSDSSTSESEVSACSSSFNPLKVLYSKKAKIPVRNAPMYENVQQYEVSLRNADIAAVGQGELVRRREEEKQRLKAKEQRELEEKNKQRFAQYQGKHFQVSKLFCCCE